MVTGDVVTGLDINGLETKYSIVEIIRLYLKEAVNSKTSVRKRGSVEGRIYDEGCIINRAGGTRREPL